MRILSSYGQRLNVYFPQESTVKASMVCKLPKPTRVGYSMGRKGRDFRLSAKFSM